MIGVRFFTERTYSSVDLKTFLYTFLCSNIVAKEPGVEYAYSSYTYSRLEALKIPELDETLQELIDEGFIQEEEKPDDYYYYVGKWEGRRKVILLHELKSTDCTTDQKEFIEQYEEAVEVSSIHKSVKDRVPGFFKKGIAPKNTAEFVELFLSYSQIWFMEEPRDALKKEYGQMKTLVGLYSSDKLVSMIMYYIKNSDDYGKALPSIGGLLFHKDEISSKLRTRKVESDDDLRF